MRRFYRKFLALVTVMALVLTVFPNTIFSADDEEVAYMRFQDSSAEQALIEAGFDTNGDGRISVDEFVSKKPITVKPDEAEQAAPIGIISFSAMQLSSGTKVSGALEYYDDEPLYLFFVPEGEDISNAVKVRVTSYGSFTCDLQPGVYKVFTGLSISLIECGRLVVGADEIIGLRISLPTPLTVSGKLSTQTGKAVPYSYLCIKPESTNPASTATNKVYGTWTDKDGNFTFTDIYKGDYTLFYPGEDKAMLFQQQITVDSSNVTGKNITMTGYAAIYGRLTKGANKPVRFSWIFAWSSQIKYGVDVLTDNDGYFVIPVPFNNSYSFSLDLTEHGVDIEDTVTVNTNDVQINFDVSKAKLTGLNGKVTNSSGGTATEIYMYLESRDNSAEFEYIGAPVPDGGSFDYGFEGLMPGKYTLVVSAFIAESGKVIEDEHYIEISKTDITYNFQFRMYTISGTISSSGPGFIGATIEASSIYGEGDYFDYYDENPVNSIPYKLKFLEPGKYNICIELVDANGYAYSLYDTITIGNSSIKRDFVVKFDGNITGEISIEPGVNVLGLSVEVGGVSTLIGDVSNSGTDNIKMPYSISNSIVGNTNIYITWVDADDGFSYRLTDDITIKSGDNTFNRTIGYGSVSGTFELASGYDPTKMVVKSISSSAGSGVVFNVTSETFSCAKLPKSNYKLGVHWEYEGKPKYTLVSIKIDGDITNFKILLNPVYSPTPSSSGIEYDLNVNDYNVTADDNTSALNLLTETFTVASHTGYSVDGGAKWKTGGLTPKAFASLLNKGGTLHLATEMQGKAPKAGSLIIKFPTIAMRPKATKYVVNYEIAADNTGLTNGGWVITVKGGQEPIRNGVIIAATDGKKTIVPDSQSQMSYGTFPAEGGINVADIAANGKQAKQLYYISTSPIATGTITPMSKTQKLRIKGISKPPSQTRNYKKEVIKGKVNMMVYFGDTFGDNAANLFGPLTKEEAKKGVDMSKYLVETGTSIAHIWINASAKKPATAKAVVTLANRAVITDTDVPVTFGSKGKPKLSKEYESFTKDKWGSKLTGDSYIIRKKAAAKSSKFGIDTGFAASAQRTGKIVGDSATVKFAWDSITPSQ